MSTNTEFRTPLLFGELSYALNGVLYSTHNEIGRFGKEKQYAILVEKKLKEAGIKYRRECVIGDSGNIADFIIEDVIILELKAKPFLPVQDYEQVKRYLDICDLQLGILVNFHSRYLQPKRILRKRHTRGNL